MSRGGVSGGLPATRWWSNEAGQRVQAARQSRGWTRSDLAQRLDVGTTRISAWESGRSGPSGDRLNALADALGLRVGADLPAHPAKSDKSAPGAVGGPSGLDCGGPDDRARRLALWALGRTPDA
ncbi:multiprotein-bridging factor 1 family protein [Nocardiopsis dassonvillei]|uniref:helix-turn-helix domain-containing protein n=1 Tax=Nocardiopsis dassonvillei TaxID=2014 RepID=UPI00366BAC49